jgi:hypothetical protein
MNEKQKSEGRLLEEIFRDNRSEAQKLLNYCKAMEIQRKLIAVQLDPKSVFLVPFGTDLDKWKERKLRKLKQFRSYH